MIDSVSHIFFLMGTTLEILLVGNDLKALDSLAWWILEDGQKTVEEVEKLYMRPLKDDTLRVSPLLDTLLSLGNWVFRKTEGTLDPFYRTPDCKLIRLDEGFYFFSGYCLWDPSAYLKGWMVDRWFSKLPAWVSSAYISFGGSSIRVRGKWKVKVKGGSTTLEDEALAVSASRKRGDGNYHLFFRGKPIKGDVEVMVRAATALEADVEATYRAILALTSGQD